MGAWDCYCALCGTSITTFCTGYHQTARGLLHRRARWSKVGYESNYGGLDPIGDDAQGTAETQPNFDPDLAARDEDCWYRMTNAVQEHASFYYEGRITRDFGYPFHAGCAKWVDHYFKDRNIPLKQLAFLLSAGVASQDGSACWTEAHNGCPDDAGIQASQEQAPQMTRAQGFTLARPDTIHWIDSLTALLGDGDGNEEQDEEAEGGGNSSSRDVGIDITINRDLEWVRRGAYEVSVARAPPPQLHGEVETQSSGTAEQEPHQQKEDPPQLFAATSSTPSQLPPHVVDGVVERLPAADALQLLSTSRAWYRYGRKRGWRALCRRDDFARVPVRTMEEALAEYAQKGVDWKHLYYCYESRSARRIWRILRFLAERAPSASDALA
ncbi:hypothetical protein DFJ73DRAFT_813671 [Zopfochytrium polystomum]|nr:hypothetical protein DFJ73DRAFT_813671 [Zopfochytrium polystomum]